MPDLGCGFDQWGTELSGCVFGGDNLFPFLSSFRYMISSGLWKMGWCRDAFLEKAMQLQALGGHLYQVGALTSPEIRLDFSSMI